MKSSLWKPESNAKADLSSGCVHLELCFEAESSEIRVMKMTYSELLKWELCIPEIMINLRECNKRELTRCSTASGAKLLLSTNFEALALLWKMLCRFCIKMKSQWSKCTQLWTEASDDCQAKLRILRPFWWWALIFNATLSFYCSINQVQKRLQYHKLPCSVLVFYDLTLARKKATASFIRICPDANDSYRNQNANFRTQDLSIRSHYILLTFHLLNGKSNE